MDDEAMNCGVGATKLGELLELEGMSVLIVLLRLRPLFAVAVNVDEDAVDCDELNPELSFGDLAESYSDLTLSDPGVVAFEVDVLAPPE